MSNKIHLYWYRHKEGHGNFGDELNPYIIKELTGSKINYVNINYFGISFFPFFKKITSDYLKSNIQFFKYLENIYYYFFLHSKVLVAIGSVLQLVKSPNYIIWGSGIINAKADFSDADFRAVRGKYTQKRLKELGYSVPDIIGDPALLLPLIYMPKAKKKYKVGIIPHHIHFEQLKGLNLENVLIINLLDRIETIIEQISSCEITYSTSLHGIIVSHAYQIPSIWLTNNDIKLGGDDIKFSDYFSSVEIDFYNPIDVNDFIRIGPNNYYSLLELNKEQILPEIGKIQRLQKDLLSVFPFRLKSNFETFLVE